MNGSRSAWMSMMLAGFIAANAGAQSETATFAADFERFRAAIRANDAEAAADLCGTYIFYFGMTADGYRLQDFVADPEASE